MSETVSKRIRLIYGIALSAATILAGGCLIAACVGIYRSGDKPFSREAVATAFQGISIMIYIALALMAGGFVLALFLPRSKQKGQLPPSHMTLHRLHRKLDVEQSGPSLAADVRALQKSRRLHRIISLCLLAAGSCVFLVYALDGTHFHHQDINGSMVKAMLVLLPCMAVPCVYAVIAGYLAKKSMSREIELMLKYGVARAEPLSENDGDSKLRILRWSLLVVAAAMLLYGAFAGGTLDVLTKAINICTECVGLG